VRAVAGDGPWVIVAKIITEKTPIEHEMIERRENKNKYVSHIKETKKQTDVK
jgi:hypothetical protein